MNHDKKILYTAAFCTIGGISGISIGATIGVGVGITMMAVAEIRNKFTTKSTTSKITP